jgi:hypothetical protein
MPLNTKIAPSTMQKMPTDPMMGQGIGCGMK